MSTHELERDRGGMINDALSRVDEGCCPDVNKTGVLVSMGLCLAELLDCFYCRAREHKVALDQEEGPDVVMIELGSGGGPSGVGPLVGLGQPAWPNTLRREAERDSRLCQWMCAQGDYKLINWVNVRIPKDSDRRTNTQSKWLLSRVAVLLQKRGKQGYRDADRVHGTKLRTDSRLRNGPQG